MKAKTGLWIKRLVFSALFLALALVLPFLTGQIQTIGKMLTPMHFPVLLCGFICGPLWGMAVGIIAPLLRSLIFGMPPLFPMAVSMAFELCAYGLAAGLLYRALPKKVPYLYVSLVASMLIGRIIYGAVQYILMGFGATTVSLATLWTGTVATALPGIALQIVLIPLILLPIQKTGKMLNG